MQQHDAHHDELDYPERDHENEEAQGEIAARLLSWLVLMVLGGGLALWAGPKVAPMLPEWAAPARTFLTPSENSAKAALDNLRTEMDARFAALPDLAPLRDEMKAADQALAGDVAALTSKAAASDQIIATLQEDLDAARADMDGAADMALDAFGQQLAQNEHALQTLDTLLGQTQGDMAQQGAYAHSLEDRISEVEAGVGALGFGLSDFGDKLAGSDSADIEGRLARTESALSGIQAELENLRTDLTEAGLEDGDARAAALARLSNNAAQIGGLRTELGTLAEKSGVLSQRLDEVEAAATRQIERSRAAEAQARAEAKAAQEAADAAAKAAQMQAEADAQAAKAAADARAKAAEEEAAARVRAAQEDAARLRAEQEAARLAAEKAAAQAAAEEAARKEAKAAAQREADAKAAFAAQLDIVRTQALAGEPFVVALGALAAMDRAPIPDALSAQAATGLPALAPLQAQFRQLSFAARDASAQATAAANPTGKFGALLSSRLTPRRLAPAEGDGTDAVLSRMGAALAGDDLDRVLGEADALDAAARAVLGDWLETVTHRRDGQAALMALDAASS